jgi:hypothetical protein
MVKIMIRSARKSEFGGEAAIAAPNVYGAAAIATALPEVRQLALQVEAPAIRGFSLYGSTLAVGDSFVVAAGTWISGQGTLSQGWVLLLTALMAYPTWMFIFRLYEQMMDE